MAVLVTGGAGYIGSHTVYELIDKGYDVVVADNLTTGHAEAVHEKAKIYIGDIRSKLFLDDLFSREKIDGVIHFAASSLVGESMISPLKYYDNNLYGTMILLESMVANGIDKLIFSSSAAVYGEPESIPIKETAVTSPLNTYGETKLAMEKMIKWASIAYGIKYVALRYFNACGAHALAEIGEDHNPETHLIPLVLQTAGKQRENISIFGTDYETRDGTCIRDYVHVTDLARAHILALEYLMSGKESKVFNLGSGSGYSVAEVIKSARNITGQDILSVEMPRRAGDPAELTASNEKAFALLGWKPEFSELDCIITTAWRWHHSHPHGFMKDEGYE